MYRFRPGFGTYSPPTGNVASVLQSASDSSGVPLPILQALAFQESSYNPNAVSSAGAQGLLQLMPATAKQFGVTNPFDPSQNAVAGATYLESLYQQYGDWTSALVAYNEGPGNFAKSGAFPSSSAYASSILQNAGMSPDSTPSDTSGSDDSSSPSASPLDLSSIADSVSQVDPLVLGGLALGLLGLLYLAR